MLKGLDLYSCSGLPGPTYHSARQLLWPFGASLQYATISFSLTNEKGTCLFFFLVISLAMNAYIIKFTIFKILICNASRTVLAQGNVEAKNSCWQVKFFSSEPLHMLGLTFYMKMKAIYALCTRTSKYRKYRRKRKLTH